MSILTVRNAALALIAGVSLSGCVYDDYSYGYGGGYGYGGYPYGGSVTLGYGNYYGWNDGFYYPGSGYYIYDNYRRPHRWNNVQQRYWGDRQHAWRMHDRGEMRSNWSEFRRDRRH